MKRISFLLISSLLFFSCSEKDIQGIQNIIVDESELVTLSDVETKACVSGVQNVGCDICSALCSAGGDVLISPYSLAAEFAMMADGAEGQTYKELMDLLGIDGLSEEKLHSWWYSTKETARNSGVTVKPANSIWVDKTISLNKDYQTTVSKWYEARADALDMSSKSATKTVNSWFSAKTGGLIPEMVESVDGALALIANALCFEGQWSFPFTKHDSGLKFRNKGSQTVDVAYISTCAKMKYNEGDGFKVVSLPYKGTQGQVAMDIVIPDEGVALRDVLTKLKNTSFSTIHNESSSVQIDLKMPVFTVNYSNDMRAVLGEMGARTLTTFPDFSRMIGGQTIMASFLHKSKLTVNEVGTVAASGSLVELYPSGVGPVDAISLVVDRPFVFAVNDYSSEVSYFIGVKANM